jgi:hypothetical protein
MQIGRIERATRVLGKSQGYLGLPVRDEMFGEDPCMTSAWLPTPAELEALNNGAAVHVKLLGTQHPPILVEVGEPPC